METKLAKKPIFKSLKTTKEDLDLIQSAYHYRRKVMSNAQIESIFKYQYKGATYLTVNAVRKAEKADSKTIAKLMELKKMLGNFGKDKKDILGNIDYAYSPRTVKNKIKKYFTAIDSKQRMVFLVEGAYLSDIHPYENTSINPAKSMKHYWQSSPQGRLAKKRRLGRENVKTRGKQLFGDVYSYMVGGVHQESGLYIKARTEKISKILTTNKTPMTAERHVGLELEFLLPNVNMETIKDKLRISEYSPMLTLARDGSVTSSSKYYPAELKICAPLSQVSAVVSEITKILNAQNCIVDKSCGFHAHLDARNDNCKEMFNRLIDQQSCLLALVPASRRGNEYCKPTKRTDYQRGTRYKTINSMSYNKFKTLEVRLHGGTLDPNKIIHWVSLISTIAYATHEVKTSRAVSTMLNKFSTLSASTKEYCLERSAKFKSDN